jgi:hypothetical protein
MILQKIGDYSEKNGCSRRGTPIGTAIAIAGGTLAASIFYFSEFAGKNEAVRFRPEVNELRPISLGILLVGMSIAVLSNRAEDQNTQAEYNPTDLFPDNLDELTHMQDGAIHE